MQPEFRRSYAYRYGARTSEHTVTVDDTHVTVEQPENRPSGQKHTLVEAFERPQMLFLRDERVAFEVIENVASRLRPEDLRRDADRLRLAYWRSYRRDAVRAERLAYVHLRADHSVELAASWRLDDRGLRWKLDDRDAEHSLPDETFAFGPPTHAAPAYHRETLRRAFFFALKPDAGVAIEQGFPRLDHAACAKKSWSWARTSDGESFADIGPGYVMAGSQYGHDYGYSLFAPERVLTDRGAQLGLNVPDDVYREMCTILEATRASEAPLARVTDEERARAEALMRSRGPKGAPWAHTAALEFAGFGAVRDQPQWERGAALGLLASLAPARAIPVGAPSGQRPLYDFASDEVWAAGPDAGVLCAMVCYSNAGGIDRVWHVFPSGDRRVLFAIGTDYTQDVLSVHVGADTPEALAALRAHVEAYFAMLCAAD